MLLSSTVALAEGVTTLALAIGLQYAVAWTSVRSARVRRLVRSEPTLVVYRGQLLHDALRDSGSPSPRSGRCWRQQGRSSVEQVAALVLKTDGSFSLISDPDAAVLPIDR